MNLFAVPRQPPTTLYVAYLSYKCMGKFHNEEAQREKAGKE